ncbi:MAG: carboxypeptidase-like regulatory domain-containing protein [Pyrinomonadaceae bacterium MAG19_C2-C3]|nr:carboxypeptidase-like regulatory domain-containing protein [Pyrinomonadaceae bacterium MAG19_C2-C3]
MHKTLLTLCAALALCGSLATAQTMNQTASSAGDAPNMGRAPKEMNGIGRLDLRVLDAAGNPVPNAYATLESRRTDGFFCEAYGSTDSRGVFAMPPLHMGELKLIVKAKGFENATIAVDRNALAEPVIVRLVRKS